MRSNVLMCLLAAGLPLLASCARVTVDPIEVKPIHIVADINLRIDRELDEFFAFQERYQPPATQPATTRTAASVETQVQ